MSRSMELCEGSVLETILTYLLLALGWLFHVYIVDEIMSFSRQSEISLHHLHTQRLQFLNSLSSDEVARTGLTNSACHACRYILLLPLRPVNLLNFTILPAPPYVYSSQRIAFESMLHRLLGPLGLLLLISQASVAHPVVVKGRERVSTHGCKTFMLGHWLILYRSRFVRLRFPPPLKHWKGPTRTRKLSLTLRSTERQPGRTPHQDGTGIIPNQRGAKVLSHLHRRFGNLAQARPQSHHLRLPRRNRHLLRVGTAPALSMRHLLNPARSLQSRSGHQAPHRSRQVRVLRRHRLLRSRQVYPSHIRRGHLQALRRNQAQCLLRYRRIQSR